MTRICLCCWRTKLFQPFLETQCICD